MQSSISLRQSIREWPLVRGFTHEVSPYHTGSVLENKLGLQVLRTIGKHVAWRLRRTAVSPEIVEYANVLQRDGVLVIPNFLSPEQSAEIRAEFDGAVGHLDFDSFREVESGRMRVARHELSAEGTDFPHIRRHLQNNPLIQSLAAAVIRHHGRTKPRVLLSVYQAANERGAVDNDVENILHADLHAPTVKVFYYVDEIDERNGAFVYAKGSHRLSVSRLRHEYDMSVRTARLKRGDTNLPADLLAERGPLRRNIMTDDSRRRMKIKETSICGGAGTLVVANNMGFHRRGEFSDERPRKTILLNFRHLERCFR